jgi:hypothetical protein
VSPIEVELAVNKVERAPRGKKWKPAVREALDCLYRSSFQRGRDSHRREVLDALGIQEGWLE